MAIDTSVLTVKIYNMDTGLLQKFNCNAGMVFSESKMIHDLIAEILHEKGMLEYLRTL